MGKNQCFKIKRGTKFDSDIKESLLLRSKWDDVMRDIGILLGEKITSIYLNTGILSVPPEKIKKEDNKKLFKKDGTLKISLKKAKEINKEYLKILESYGLSKYRELPRINFSYGIMRRQGQKLESFPTSENDIYYKADFDLGKGTDDLVIPITEIEYEEKYVEELKKRDEDERQDG